MNAVDTNVLVYAIDHHVPAKQVKAIELLDRLAQPPAQTVLMWQVAGEYLSCLRRWQGIGRITANEVEQYLHRALAVLPLSYPTQATLEISLDLSNRYSLSHWYSMLIGACIEAAVDTLYSEDLSDRTTYDSVTVINPFA